MDCVETDCQSVTDTFFYSYRELDLFYFRFWLGIKLGCLLCVIMKQAEEVTAVCPLVLKCHRAFLVNVRKVVKVNGNSQGYRLLLEGCPEEIPVSRGYSKQVKELIEGISGD